jgi:two-component system cell cycle response regulator
MRGITPRLRARSGLPPGRNAPSARSELVRERHVACNHGWVVSPEPSRAPATLRPSVAALKRAARANETALSGSNASVVRDRALLLVISGPEQGLVQPLREPSVRIGRDSDAAEISVSDQAVSNLHARITRELSGSYVEDLGSRNGTFVNDERLRGRRRLLDGDHVRLGNTILRYSLLDELEERTLTGLFDQTVRDQLTGVYNRRHFDDCLQRELSYARRQCTNLSLLMIDIDFFKRVNDTYGHRVGDAVLRIVATSIQRVLRAHDVLARYGGEEFVIVARDTNLRNAEILAERVRRRIEKLRFEVPGGTTSVTVSVGVVAVTPHVGYPGEEALLKSVDAALYSAKRTGRNRVTSMPPKPPAPSRPTSAPA